jgi:hypothetical protein
MSRNLISGLVLLIAIGWGASAARGADKLGLQPRTPEFQSVGPMAFGPDGILFVGDPQAAAVVAIDTGEARPQPAATSLKVEHLQTALADVLSASAPVQVVDLAVHPQSGEVFVSVRIGEQPAPRFVRISGEGQLSVLPLDGILTARAELPNAPEDKEVGEGRRRRNPRRESITDIAYVDGQIIVSGLQKAEAPSGVQSIPFPFAQRSTVASLEIYHGAHGRLEDYAPIRVFVPFNINGEPHLLAGFTCTPLVKFPVEALRSDGKVRGTTVAELGNRNQPLDMIAYQQDGQNFLLTANSARGVMKISTAGLDRAEGIIEPVSGGGTAGQEFETIESLQGVVQLDKLGETHAVLLMQAAGGELTLAAIPLP